MRVVPVVAGDRLGSAGRAALDETIRKAERVSRVEFSVFVGQAEGEPRDFARSLHAQLVAPKRSILVMVDPDIRAVEVVTGSDVRRTLADPQVELALAAMQSQFVDGDLVGGLRRGIQLLAENARAPQTLHTQQP
jgi:uncharacterized membrane protein YgcG